jgi:hypothetical protein
MMDTNNPHILINLTNHPSEYWNERQKSAALEYGEIVDMPFPNIAPDGDEEYIRELSEEYCNKVTQYTQDCHVTVHLMGEFSFSFALLKLLQEHDISCIVSTTKRIVSESPEEGKKEVTFEFVRFRRLT